MIRSRKFKLLLAVLALGFAFRAPSAIACAMCFGQQSDSPLAQGMNWGIFSLLATIVSVLGGIATFFIYLAKKSAGAAITAPDAALPKQTQKA